MITQDVGFEVFVHMRLTLRLDNFIMEASAISSKIPANPQPLQSHPVLWLVPVSPGTLKPESRRALTLAEALSAGSPKKPLGLQLLEYCL